MSRGRKRTVKALVALGSVLAFLSVFGIWVERQVLNTDDWVHTSDKLIRDKTIRSALSNYLVDQLYTNVDIEKELEEILPGETKQLAGPVSGGLRQVAGDGAEKLLETSTAQNLWEDANRSSHEQLVDVLENNKEAVSTENGEVKLELASLVTNLASQVGIGASLAEKLPPDAADVTILRSDQLKTAQNIAIAMKGLAIILSLLTFVAFGLAIYLSGEERWVTVLFCGIGLVAAGFAVIVAREVSGGIVVGALVTEDSVKPAAEQTWSIATSLMTSIATTVIVVGVLFGVAGWLASPTGSAKSTRRYLAPPLRDHPAYVYSGLAVIVGLYFLSASVQNLRSFLTTLAIAGLTAYGIHGLRKQTEEEYPDTTYEELFGSTRDRLVGAVKSGGANLGERASKMKMPEVRMPGGGEAAGGERAASATADDARLERLERLGALHEKGILSDEELAAEKARLLGAPTRPECRRGSRSHATWRSGRWSASAPSAPRSAPASPCWPRPARRASRESGGRWGPAAPKARKAPSKSPTSASSNPKSKTWRRNSATSAPPKAASKNSKKTSPAPKKPSAKSASNWKCSAERAGQDPGAEAAGSAARR